MGYWIQRDLKTFRYIKCSEIRVLDYIGLEGGGGGGDMKRFLCVILFGSADIYPDLINFTLIFRKYVLCDILFH